MIELKNLQKYFYKGKQNEIHVINDVSLSLPERGMVAVFGRSGCGKTTLLNVIGGLDGFESGTLTVAGESITENTDEMRNRYIGYIFQNYNLSREESCFDNVANALRLCGVTDGEVLQERVHAALRNVGMAQYAARTPDTLSGGQQQRIAIARAIVKNPPVILADEPTGNLDEANTVMIMDLLKEISRDHLVLLVTHEAHLVDHYCDTVIELRDGAVVNIRQNESAEGLSVRDKNLVYLGEMPKAVTENERVKVEYYGEPTDTPVAVKIVNRGGKLYLQVDTTDVQVLDENSEIKLREGVFEEKRGSNAVSEHVDMSALPPIEGSCYGKLFSFVSSVKSGYRANFKKAMRSKGLLRGCLALCAAVVVFMSAVFGTALDTLITASESYNHNMFYVYSSSYETSALLQAAAADPESGIDSLHLLYSVPNGQRMLRFRVGSFETFISGGSVQAGAVLLPATLSKELTAVTGKSQPAEGEIIITTAVADVLLEIATVGYITAYEDLTGMICTNVSVRGKNLRVAGVVRSDEPAAYLSPLDLARYTLREAEYTEPHQLMLDTDLGMDVAPGHVVAALRYQEKLDVKAGEGLTVRGEELVLDALLQRCSSYARWLKLKGIEKQELKAYLAERGIDNEDTPLFYEYFAYYFAEMDAYLRESAIFERSSSFELWLYTEKGVTDVLYQYTQYEGLAFDEYYKAICYKAQHGAFPSPTALKAAYDDLPTMGGEIDKSYYLYEEEFLSFGNTHINNVCYVLDETDYMALSSRRGISKLDSLFGSSGMISSEEEKEGGNDALYAKGADVMVDVDYSYQPIIYTALHSSDPKKTEAYLRARFDDVKVPYEYLTPLLTPDDVFESLIEDARVSIAVGLTTMGIFLLVICLCMYFIMRASLMNRIKEVGIYRAIGVSKRNLIFKFLVEAGVLATLTSTVGFLLASLFIRACLGISPMVKSLFFYPFWMALLLLAFLYGICLFFGALPIVRLLRRTPSEILSKYDI